MRQYLDVKARYPDAIVFFRLGDFYEMFYEDAVYVARALNLTLTTRDKGKEKDEAVPMCGVPHHAVRGYLAKLNELGHRVALCEQLEDPKVIPGETYVLCPDVSRLKFSFYDYKKKEWESEWSTLSASGYLYPPSHVRITLTVIDERGQEVSYSTDARIRVTDNVRYRPVSNK